ncbi:ATP-grasp domain-containing protein [Nonomuraea mesophila]|uniref:ATP-grasp domain-containing protein n=1 Tax=Nonomuraea mesophila TaxID=2530382 RepID=A0A4R5FFI1_9ACTN|nr:ATP-grasp domain-containing protein [Nonomuraea mesophila]TDE49034.1 ATP-grasp domain-containing protein [Nonomuraea mesophila]
MKRLVILGGSDGTISSYRAAHRLGLGTICVDMRADAPGVREAGEFLHLSTRDVDAVTAALHGRDDVAGVLAPGSDINLPSLVEVAARLRLPGTLTPAALRASVDKAYFREVCLRLGLRGPAYVSGAAGEVVRDAARLRFPVIVKPIDSGSSRGITICTAPAELGDAARAAAAVSPSATVIAEEVVTGQDLCGEAFLQDGKVALLGLSDRVVEPPNVVAVGHDMAPRDQRLTEEVARQLELVCAEVGHTDGPVNLDLFVTGDGIVLIEMGARIGGNGMGEALGLMHGVDTVTAAVQLAIGQRPDLRPSHVRHAAVRMLRAGSAGTLRALDGLADVRALPQVADVVVTAEPGDRVVPYTECRAKLGYVLASGDSAGELAATLATVDDLLRIRVDAG